MTDQTEARALVERFKTTIAQPDRPNVIAAHVDDVAALCDHLTAALDEVERLTAENERLRDSLVGIKRAATARMSARENCKHSYYFHTASAALEVKP